MPEKVLLVMVVDNPLRMAPPWPPLLAPLPTEFPVKVLFVTLTVGAWMAPPPTALRLLYAEFPVKVLLVMSTVPPRMAPPEVVAVLWEKVLPLVVTVPLLTTAPVVALVTVSPCRPRETSLLVWVATLMPTLNKVWLVEPSKVIAPGEALASNVTFLVMARVLPKVMDVGEGQLRTRRFVKAFVSAVERLSKVGHPNGCPPFNSYAPMSHFAPPGRAKPRWSVARQREFPLGI